ncbi:hypothetical protein N656DRAFT_773412 [Canariomyces notabilis]|uniref:Uncharacterized protein n=1 Tax=Canariomyces notabilis TaxID=2074819 RepID=A0AAN6YX48_9PEZI|nr:hypothetical protein N656DRAFT_773412 [Canariomyces arenarius]
MGNLCSTEKSDPFSQPGRRLGTAPAAGPSSVSVPPTASSRKPTRVGGPPRTLGGGGGGGEGSGDGAGDPRTNAALAAEARFQKSKQGGGKLKAGLDAQRSMTDSVALKQASEEERRRRDMDQGAGALRHD